MRGATSRWLAAGSSAPPRRCSSPSRAFRSGCWRRARSPARHGQLDRQGHGPARAAVQRDLEARRPRGRRGLRPPEPRRRRTRRRARREARDRVRLGAGGKPPLLGDRRTGGRGRGGGRGGAGGRPAGHADRHHGSAVRGSRRRPAGRPAPARLGRLHTRPRRCGRGGRRRDSRRKPRPFDRSRKALPDPARRRRLLDGGPRGAGDPDAAARPRAVLRAVAASGLVRGRRAGHRRSTRHVPRHRRPGPVDPLPPGPGRPPSDRRRRGPQGGTGRRRRALWTPRRLARRALRCRPGQSPLVGSRPDEPGRAADDRRARAAVAADQRRDRILEVGPRGRARRPPS